MNGIARTLSLGVLAAALAGGLGGCSNMSRVDKATAVGAGVGAVGGAVLTDSALGTAAGAVAGGVIGREYEKKK